MAGFREFVTGEVLTAANVDDYLMQQAVMKFADATARDTALGTAVGGGNALREGMVAYLDDTDTVISYDGTSWATVGNAGIGTNVVSALKTDAFSTTSSSPTAVTGLSVTITLTSATSKILVIGFVHVSAAAVAAANCDVTLLRDSSAIAVSTAGTTFNATAGPRITAATGNLFSATISVLDSPATTSAVQYDIGLSSNASTAYVNRAGASAQNGYFSSITAIEVAA